MKQGHKHYFVNVSLVFFYHFVRAKLHLHDLNDVLGYLVKNNKRLNMFVTFCFFLSTKQDKDEINCGSVCLSVFSDLNIDAVTGDYQQNAIPHQLT